MVKVDNVRVFVFQRSVPVGMTMGLRSFPSLVLMAMVVIMDMQVLVLERAVQVLQFAERAI